MQNQQGYTITEMAEFIGVWQRTLSEWLITHGITGDIETKRYPRFSQAKFEEIKRLRAQSNHVGAWIKKKSADKTQAEQSKGGIEMKDKDDAQIRDQSPNGVHSKKNRPRTGRKDKSMNNNCSQDFEQFAADYPQSSTDYCGDTYDISQEEIDEMLQSDRERETAQQSQQNSSEQNVRVNYTTDAKETKPAKPIQHFENLPDEIINAPRFFLVGEDKVPLTKAWSNPENQRHYRDVKGVAGFDTCGRGQAVDYLLMDFDHIFTDTGEFVNETVKQWFHAIQDKLKSFCERSISGHGAHILAKPTADKFNPISNGKNGVLHFGDGAKLELFYKSKGRYCLVTGDVFECEPKAPVASGELVDEVLQKLLDVIQRQLKAKEKPAEQKSEQAKPTVNRNNSAHDTREREDEPEYNMHRAHIMLDCIDPSTLEPNDWFAVISACKNIGIDYPTVDAWNQRDPSRYNAIENQSRWDSVTDTSFNIETLHGFAKRFGYDEADTWHEYHGSRKRSHKTPPSPLNLSDDNPQSLFTGDASDDDFAQRMVFMFGNQFRYLQETDEWFTYKSNQHGGGLWKNGGQKNSTLYPFATELAKKLAANAHSKTEQELAERFKSTKKKSTTIAAIKGITDVIITLEDLNTHNNLLNVMNGVVDLETGKLYPADPSLLLTQQAKAIYRAGYRNKIVDGFLKSILPDEETLAGLMRYLGYAATGECSEEKALFCNGGGGNGKGTMTKTLMHLFGDYAATLKTSAVLLMNRSQDAGAATTELNPLINCRVAIVEELPQGGRLDVAKFKNLTGGDMIPMRLLHQEQINVEPHFSPILSGNYLPELSDTRDPGLKRRLLNIVFEQTFTGEARDPNLKTKLSTADALSGLLSIVVTEAVAWYKHGLIISAAMEQATKDYLDENDFIAEFIEENCERGARLSITRKDFLDRLKNGDYAAECLKQFGNNDRALTSAIKRIEGIEYRRSGRTGGNAFVGIGWKGAPKQSTLDQCTPISPDDCPPF